MRRLAAFLFLAVLVPLAIAPGCGGDNASDLCSAWINAPCPSGFFSANSLSQSDCEENFDLECSGDDCDDEYTALLQCETDSPLCCDGTTCQGSATTCESQENTWEDCVDRVRSACGG